MINYLRIPICLSLILLVTVTVALQEKNRINISEAKEQAFYYHRPISSSATAPSGRLVGFFLHPNKDTTEEASLIIFDLWRNTSQKVYNTNFASWDVVGNLHWLDDDNIFFLRHCGTACRGITLLNLESRQITNAVLSYPPFPNQPVTTHFKDWFGQEFDFDGLVANVYSETKGKNTYLVFTLEDYIGNSLGDVRLFFNGTNLRNTVYKI